MFLEVTDLSKAFHGERVLDRVSFSVAPQSTLAILGRSGCGKTTLLRTIAGLTAADAGRVVVDGADISSLPPEKRGSVYLYQEPLLFPHLSVFDNVAFGLAIRKRPKAEIDRAVGLMIDRLELTAHARKMPQKLSGGQRQRVSFGRALIVNLALLLLDEPFSNLDEETRSTMQQLFKRVA